MPPRLAAAWGWVNHALDRVADAITAAVGSMWTALLFTCLALVSLPNTLATGDPVAIVAWIAQTFLQLVLLSVILVSQNRGQAVLDGLVRETHDSVFAELQEVRAIAEAVHAHVSPTAPPPTSPKEQP